MELGKLRSAATQLLSPRVWAWRRSARQLGPGFSEDAETYRGLSNFSLLFSSVLTLPGPRRINLVIPTAEPARVFAGIKTALAFAGALAESLRLPLRVVTMDPHAARRPSTLLAPALVPAEYQGPPVECFNLGAGHRALASGRDIWIVTHWTTAHAADVACRVGALEASRVIYLVQDYEPGFEPWSTSYALIRATYHAGFRIVVNSRPLAEHLRAEEGISVADDQIVAPNLDVARLRVASERRSHAPPIGVFFYGRPTKPRNLYPLGIAALRRAARLLGKDAAHCRFYSAGEPHSAVQLGHDARLEVMGQTGWDGYFELLSRVHVGLSLMYSPHPSHPPLELAISGARVVTNRFAAARDGLHPAICSVQADPDALGSALAEAVGAALQDGPLPFLDIPSGQLGGPLRGVAAALARGFAC